VPLHIASLSEPPLRLLRKRFLRGSRRSALD
jgi:hypothetical protein